MQKLYNVAVIAGSPHAANYNYYVRATSKKAAAAIINKMWVGVDYVTQRASVTELTAIDLTICLTQVLYDGNALLTMFDKLNSLGYVLYDSGS